MIIKITSVIITKVNLEADYFVAGPNIKQTGIHVLKQLFNI